MKRTELIGRLLKEGFSEKTLVNFTDKQLNDLSERIVTVKSPVVPRIISCLKAIKA